MCTRQTKYMPLALFSFFCYNYKGLLLVKKGEIKLSKIKMFSLGGLDENGKNMFVIEIDKNIPKYIILDGVRTRQILFNLIGNAIKFTEKGYIKLKENIAKTTEVIHDISISSSEQRTSIEQINDVVNRLDRQTQNNASIATQTQDIAINTSNIAKKILETVNEKEFRNK